VVIPHVQFGALVVQENLWFRVAIFPLLRHLLRFKNLRGAQEEIAMNLRFLVRPNTGFARFSKPLCRHTVRHVGLTVIRHPYRPVYRFP
jgi:hypothetical protein